MISRNQKQSLRTQFVRWGSIIAEYFVATAISKLLVMVSSLLLVRHLDIAQYGKYTFALALLTFLCGWADLGALETLSFFWKRTRKHSGKYWNSIVMEVQRVRRYLLLIVNALAATYLVVSSEYRAFDDLYMFFVIVLAAALSQQISLYTYIFRLSSLFRIVYSIEIANEIGKVVLVVLMICCYNANAKNAISIIAISYFIVYLYVRRVAPRLGYRLRSTSKHQRTQSLVFAQMRPTLFGYAFFSAQGMFVTVLTVYAGGVETVAQIGALGRLGVLVTMLGSFVCAVFLPKLIAVQGVTLFRRRYLQIVTILAIFSITMLCLAAVFPDVILVIIGSQYRGLTNELLLMTLTSVCTVFGGFAWGVSRAKGWVRHHHISIVLMMVLMLAVSYIVDLTTARGALLLGAVTPMVGCLWQISTNWRGFRSERKMSLASSGRIM